MVFPGSFFISEFNVEPGIPVFVNVIDTKNFLSVPETLENAYSGLRIGFSFPHALGHLFQVWLRNGNDANSITRF